MLKLSSIKQILLKYCEKLWKNTKKLIFYQQRQAEPNSFNTLVSHQIWSDLDKNQILTNTICLLPKKNSSLTLKEMSDISADQNSHKLQPLAT